MVELGADAFFHGDELAFLIPLSPISRVGYLLLERFGQLFGLVNGWCLSNRLATSGCVGILGIFLALDNRYE